jgi:hypothetical protein
LTAGIQSDPNRAGYKRKLLPLAGALLLLAVIGAATYGWYGLTQPFVSAGVLEEVAGADSARLERHVRKLASEFPDRTFDNKARLEGAAGYIESELSALGAKVESQRFEAGGRAYRNLVVKLGPDTPDVLVIGAHYDVAGAQPGADDNASGVAGLIELARLLLGSS